MKLIQDSEAPRVYKLGKLPSEHPNTRWCVATKFNPKGTIVKTQEEAWQLIEDYWNVKNIVL